MYSVNRCTDKGSPSATKSCTPSRITFKISKSENKTVGLKQLC